MHMNYLKSFFSSWNLINIEKKLDDSLIEKKSGMESRQIKIRGIHTESICPVDKVDHVFILLAESMI